MTPRPNLRQRPLSFAQQRLWLLAQSKPESPGYNIPVAHRLRGPLNVPALELALSEIVRRHEILRTLFEASDGEPLQLVVPHHPLALPVVDLRGLPDGDREARAMQLVTEDAHRPFDLAQDPLFRAALVGLAEEDHVFLLNMHHIVSDAWSTGVFLRELASLYTAFSTGKPSPLPELPIQYADFAVWQRQWLQGEGLEDQLAYWREQLAGPLPVLQLPTDRPRPAIPTFRGAKQALRLPTPLSEALKALSRREGVTVFMTLLAAVQALLHRYTGQEDIVVGSPMAGRTRAELEGLIGFFVNTLVLRTDLSGNPTFRDLLQRVRAVALGAYAHQELPFERLVEALQPARRVSQTPLFQVFVNMLNVPDQRLALPGLTVEALAPPAVEAKFDLTLYVRDQPEGLHCEVVYNADLFAQTRMVEWLAQLQQWLAHMVERPAARIAQVSLVTPTAAARLPNPTEPLCVAWEGPVQARFSQQARRVPERPAVVDPHDVWSYAELEARSHQLAHYLRAHGLQPQEVVAIYGHRSASLVWALLGVLKAGAAFVILDPAYPASRLAACLRVAKPRGWLQLEAAGALPAALEAVVAAGSWRCRVTLPRRAAAAASGLFQDYATAAPEVAVGPDDLAYVVFTSGSTGQPQGIRGGQRPLAHFLAWYTRTFGLSDTDRFSLLSGLAHDPLLRDLFTPLWLGATLFIPDPESLRSPGQLLRWMQHQALSVVHLTPALSELLTALSPSAAGAPPREMSLPSLRYACFGGEALTQRDVVRLRALAPVATCVNFYGTTETPQVMGYFVIPDEAAVDRCDEPMQDASGGRVPVGRGIQDVQLLVLNTAQQLAGIGEIGEIYIRTPYLSQGYIDDEALTRARFLVNPLTHDPADRLYKTGDRGRYRPDGNVDFLGRLDTQVNVRGFRIEVGEVEAVLRQHPAVREAVVVAREDDPGVKELVAYVVAYQQPGPSTSELRRFLQGALPDYMMPSAFVLIDALPLTPNGKLDRHALPAPEGLRPELEADFIAPRSEAERSIAAIWQEVLHTDKVGLHDNFFDLGGHSLLLVRVYNKLPETFRTNLSVIDLFKYPTIYTLTNYLSQKQHRQDPFPPNTGPLEKLNAGKDRLKQLYQRRQRAPENG